MTKYILFHSCTPARHVNTRVHRRQRSSGSHYVLAYRGFPRQALEGFLITVALADLTNTHTQTHTSQRSNSRTEVRPSARPSAHLVSPRPRPNALPHNALAAAGRQEHYDLLKPQQYSHTEYLDLFWCVYAQVQPFLFFFRTG